MGKAGKSNWMARVARVAQDIGGASAWDQSMGGPTTGLPTWHQYTGLAYEVASPPGPIKVLGFFLNYSYDSQTGRVAFPPEPMTPGSTLRGFFLQGSSKAKWSRVIALHRRECGGRGDEPSAQVSSPRPPHPSQADQCISLTDGAKWIAAQICRMLLLIKVMLLDFYHLSQHMHEAAKCCLGETPQAKDWTAAA